MRALLLALAACGDARPLANDPPLLVELNGIPVLDQRAPIDLPTPRVGTDLRMVLVVVDPEDDPVTVWFPRGPPGLQFDPWDTEGVWHYTEADTPWVTLELVVWDEHPDDPRSSTYSIHLE